MEHPMQERSNLGRFLRAVEVTVGNSIFGGERNNILSNNGVIRGLNDMKALIRILLAVVLRFYLLLRIGSNSCQLPAYSYPNSKERGPTRTV